MSAVKPKRLGDLITLKRGYDLPEKDRTLGDFPVISSAGISGYHNEYKVEGEGVVTGRYGTLGQMYFIDGKYWPHNTALYVQDFKGNDPRYIYYLLNCIGRIRTSDKSAVPGVNRNELHEMAVPSIEDTNIQISVRTLLWSIDKKIALNNKINTELESMAKLIYDYWFVQFDFPDANGKPYKSSGGKMVYNEALKREIPEGWEVNSLEHLVDVVTDTISPSEICSNTPYIGLEHIPRKTIVLAEWETASKVDSNKSAFKKLDILFGKIRPYFHKVGIGFIDGITSTDTIILRAKKPEFHGFALQTVFTERFVEVATNSSTGTKMPRANWLVLKKYKVPTPSDNVLRRYQSMFDDVLAKMENLIYQNRELTELRDWLLPMLMNGQVTVKDTAS